MQSSPPLPLLLKEKKSLPTQRASGKLGMKQSCVSIGSVQLSRFPLPRFAKKKKDQKNNKKKKFSAKLECFVAKSAEER